jgi:hypothetical protein
MPGSSGPSYVFTGPEKKTRQLIAEVMAHTES